MAGQDHLLVIILSGVEVRSMGLWVGFHSFSRFVYQGNDEFHKEGEVSGNSSIDVMWAAVVL